MTGSATRNFRWVNHKMSDLKNFIISYINIKQIKLYYFSKYLSSKLFGKASQQNINSNKELEISEIWFHNSWTASSDTRNLTKRKDELSANKCHKNLERIFISPNLSVCHNHSSINSSVSAFLTKPKLSDSFG